MPITALKASRVQAFLAQQESLAPATYNRRLAVLRSFTRWPCDQRWLADALLNGVEQKPEEYRIARVLVRALTLLIHGRGDRLREISFSRTVWTLLFVAVSHIPADSVSSSLVPKRL